MSKTEKMSDEQLELTSKILITVGKAVMSGLDKAELLTVLNEVTAAITECDDEDPEQTERVMDAFLKRITP